MPGLVHEALLAPIAEHFAALGALVSREHRVRTGRTAPVIDLYAEHQDLRIVVEAEMRPNRVVNDVAKAVEVAADLLFIVVPTTSIADAARQRLEGIRASRKLRTWILPYGQALHRLRNCFPLSSRP